MLSVTHHLQHRHAETDSYFSPERFGELRAGLLTRTSCVCIPAVGSSYLYRERHRNGVGNEPSAVTLNSGPFLRDLGDSFCQEGTAVAVAVWERTRGRGPGSSVDVS